MNPQDLGPIVILSLCGGIVIGWICTWVALSITYRRHQRTYVERGPDRRNEDLGPEARQRFRSGGDRRQPD